MNSFADVRGYRVRTDVAYEPSTDLWLDTADPSAVTIGLDPLGAETSGTLAQLSMVPPGSTVSRGEPLGSLEAEKFVGPLLSPLSGTVLEVNADALANPLGVHKDPYGTWLMRIEPSGLEADLAGCVSGEAIPDWFAAKVEDYKRRGVLAQ